MVRNSDVVNENEMDQDIEQEDTNDAPSGIMSLKRMPGLSHDDQKINLEAGWFNQSGGDLDFEDDEDDDSDVYLKSSEPVAPVNLENNVPQETEKPFPPKPGNMNQTKVLPDRDEIKNQAEIEKIKKSSNETLEANMDEISKQLTPPPKQEKVEKKSSNIEIPVELTRTNNQDINDILSSWKSGGSTKKDQNIPKKPAAATVELPSPFEKQESQEPPKKPSAATVELPSPFEKQDAQEPPKKPSAATVELPSPFEKRDAQEPPKKPSAATVEMPSPFGDKNDLQTPSGATQNMPSPFDVIVDEDEDEDDSEKDGEDLLQALLNPTPSQAPTEEKETEENKTQDLSDIFGPGNVIRDSEKEHEEGDDLGDMGDLDFGELDEMGGMDFSDLDGDESEVSDDSGEIENDSDEFDFSGDNPFAALEGNSSSVNLEPQNNAESIAQDIFSQVSVDDTDSFDVDDEDEMIKENLINEIVSKANLAQSVEDDYEGDLEDASIDDVRDVEPSETLSRASGIIGIFTFPIKVLRLKMKGMFTTVYSKIPKPSDYNLSWKYFFGLAGVALWMIAIIWILSKFFPGFIG